MEEDQIKEKINLMRKRRINISEDVKELEAKTVGLRKELNELRYTLNAESAKIQSFLRQQYVGIDSLLATTSDTSSPASFPTTDSVYPQRFPISSISELAKLEESINDENSSKIVVIIHKLLVAEGVRKSLTFILASDVIMELNLKLLTLNYPKFLDLLYQAATLTDQTDSSNHEEFLNDVHHGIMLIKNQRRQVKREVDNTTISNSVENLNDQTLDGETEPKKKMK